MSESTEIATWLGDNLVPLLAGALLPAVLLAVAAVLLVRQRRRINALAKREGMVNDMPVCYMEGRMEKDAEGKAIGVEFVSGNGEADELAAGNTDDGDRNALFEKGYLFGLLETLCATGRSVVFTHYFARTDTYYSFRLCQTSGGDGVDLFGVDITEEMKKEKGLVAAREAAEESERLKSTFLANMSHEIRTPLNAIVGFSNLLTTETDQIKREKYMNIIENNNQLLLQLVGDILDLTKIEADTMEFVDKPTDLNELLRGIGDTVRARLQPGVTFVCKPGMAACCVETEPNRLSQVIINLLTNACKFTSQGSITLGYEVRGDELYFFVRDTGCGIPEEERANVFQRFTKLQDFAQGNGLGLCISKSIVEKMKGRIGVDSKGEGEGCTFWFTVPYRPVSVKETEVPAEEPREEDGQEKVSLLVAEDNESNYMLFESALGSHYRLLHAWDGVEAVELFDRHHPRLVAMDINMPGMDGYEATREIRKRSATVPIIAVTAYAFASDRERILEKGFNGYVSKPVNFNKLDEMLKSALASRPIL